jgi:hypothetical protein
VHQDEKEQSALGHSSPVPLGSRPVWPPFGLAPAPQGRFNAGQKLNAALPAP